jgi:hypothetical protein
MSDAAQKRALRIIALGAKTRITNGLRSDFPFSLKTRCRSAIGVSFIFAMVTQFPYTACGRGCVKT